MTDAQMVVQNAIGGENVTTTVEGRERYPSTSATCPTSGPTSGRSGSCRSRRPTGSGRFRSPSWPRWRGHRPVDDPQRGRPADRLCVRGFGRP
jgi:hypothetical protein